MTVTNDEEGEPFFRPFGFERDLPLTFHWRTHSSAIAALDLPACRNPRHEDARNAVLTEAKLAYESNCWVSFSRRKAFYVGRRRYHGTSFTCGNVLAAVGDGVNAGLIEEQRARPGSRGRQSRLRPTPLLSKLLNGRPVQSQLYEVIWLRDAKRRLVNYVDTWLTHRMRKEVEAINSTMAGITVGLDGPDVHKAGSYWVVAGNLVIPTPPRVRRVFNRSSFDKGGRLYGWWQGLRSRHRATMTLNGEAVLEPDYAQFHAQIIYALREIPLISDAYETGEFPRDHGKMAFNIAVNAKNQRGAIVAISEHLKMERRTASRLLDAIIAKHKPVADVFCSDAGVTLMRIDSDITLLAIKDCQSCSIPVLPVHDSLIVPARDAERVAEIMVKAFATSFPRTSNCQVRTKSRMVPQMGGMVRSCMPSD
jgi:hypothetical protein